MKLHARIFAGLAGGIALGAVAKSPGAELVQRAVLAIEPVGTLFIRAISMVVVPLVVASLFVGVASLGDVRRLGRIGGKTLAYFAATTFAAASIGLGVALVAGVGSGVESSVRDLLIASQPGPVPPVPPSPTFVQTVIGLVPTNPFAAAASGDLLPLIVAVCAFAAAAAIIAEERRRAVVTFFEGINDLAMVVVGWLMPVAPVAVFVLVAATVARAGIDVLRSLALFALVVVAALAVHTVIVLIPIVRTGARLGVRAFARATSDALLLAFSTASSNATLPVSMAAASDRLGISSGIVAFLLPAGATLNKNGAAVYKAVTAVFIAHLYGVPLDLGRLAAIVLVSTMAAFTGAGVPGSSLVTTLIVLNAIGLGPHASEGIALVVGVDRPLDMCRTAVNTFGNLAGAAFIARTEHEAIHT